MAANARTPAMIGGGFEADPLLFTSLLGLASAAAFLGSTTVGATTLTGNDTLQFRGAVMADGLSAGSGILILLLSAAVLLAVTGHGKSHERGERRRGGEFFKPWRAAWKEALNRAIAILEREEKTR